jgi:S-adenosylmethionine:tRNA ribosyltransferase-isomerase
LAALVGDARAGGTYAAAVQSASFDYDLPPHAIAQQPTAQRDQARLLVDRGPGRPAAHRIVADLPDHVGPGDLLVLNSTRVLPARLRLRKPTGGAAEVLLVAPVASPDGAPSAVSSRTWHALVRPSRRLPVGIVLTPAVPHPAGMAGSSFAVRVGEEVAAGMREVVLEGVDDVMAALEAVGEVPLPPYITAGLDDAERYQTVYARRPGSSAAPTAGLHLTDDVLDRCRQAGAGIAEVELVIGPGTFVPLTAEHLEDHRMHAEWYEVPEATRSACLATLSGQGRVVAVGTTVVRALESWAATGAPTGETDLFIRPGFAFGVVDRLMTNFHQPRSTLLVLLEAFMGRRWRELYAEALAEGYRFLSFGDAMVVDRHTDTLPGGPT